MEVVNKPKENEGLFPIFYNGNEYQKKDCVASFLSFYKNKFDLDHIGGVFMSEGLHIYPDGSISEF